MPDVMVYGTSYVAVNDIFDVIIFFNLSIVTVFTL